MPQTIGVTEEQLHDDVPVAVYWSQRLDLPQWTEVPNLFLDRLRESVAPDVDEANFTYHYGQAGGMLAPEIAAPDFATVEPLDLNGKFCKVVFDPEGTVTEDNQPLRTWYGIFESDVKQVEGSSGTDATGIQSLTAYGLLRLLEREIVRTAVVKDDTDTKRIARGLAFNRPSQGRREQFGNRSSAEISDVYVFSDKPTTIYQWTAETAVKHLLKHHTPHQLLESLETIRTPIVEWEFAGNEGDIDWYEISEETDGRSVKEILDSLINRRRGVGYYVRFDPDAVKVKLYTFNFFDFSPVPAGGPTVEQNPDVYSFNFEEAFNIVDCTLTDSIHTQYHRVVCLGERKTSTCTLTFEVAKNQMAKDWTSAEETAYEAGASDEDGYGDLDPGEQQLKNSLVRSEDKYYHVFRRFRLNDDWPQYVDNEDPDAEDDNDYWVAPLLDEAGDPAETDSDSDVGESFWHRGARFLDYLPLFLRYEYDGSKITLETTGDNFSGDGETDYMKPFLFTRTVTGADEDPDRWERLDTGNTAQFEEGGRDWSVAMDIADNEPALLLDVRPETRGQTMFVTSQTSGSVDSWAGAVEQEQDPTNRNPVDYANLYTTICLELDARVEVSRTITTPEEGEQSRELFISVPDARLDYVVPKTIVAIEFEAFIQSDGGFVRDDRTRLENIAFMAAEWYGRERQALSLTVGGLFAGFDLGYLIAEIGETYNKENINLPITAMEWNTASAPQTLKIETSYADLDFVN